ncbi:MAG: aminopeptidase P family protein [Eubacterium sp.]|nr:aminopeptidase P family protein [Eubacterium sp.]
MGLNSIFDEKGVDGILVTDEYNFHYLSGFGGEGILFITKDSKNLITDSRYTIDAKASAGKKGYEVWEYSRDNTVFDILTDLIAQENVKTIGFEDLNIKYSSYKKYTEKFRTIEFKEIGDAIESLRMVKTDEEIELLAMAEKIGDMAFKDILPMIKPGISELSLAAEIEYAMKRNGAEGFSFDTIVAAGEGGASPHHVPGEYILKDGDFVTMDFGCIYKGYCSDMTRTVVIGKPTDEQVKVYNTVLKAQLAALDALKPGVTGKSVDKIARDIISEAGYGEYFGHGLGHSVGLFIHEEPRLSPAENRELAPGNIVTVEPGIYIEGFGGVRIEDMVVITKDGYRNLASSPKELLEV